MADRGPAASPEAMRKLTPDQSSERESERENKSEREEKTNYITIWKGNSKFSTHYDLFYYIQNFCSVDLVHLFITNKQNTGNS